LRRSARRDTPERRRGSIALPALVSGVGLALSLPPWGWWILAFPSAGLLWWRLGGLRPRTRLWAGYLAGLGCYVPGLIWVRTFTAPGAVALIAIEAGFTALACLAVPSGPAVSRALAFPAALTLSEGLRINWPFGGLPLGGVFLGQADGPVLGVARLGGPLALTAVVYLGGVAVAALVEAAVRAWRTASSRTTRTASSASRATRTLWWIGMTCTAVLVAIAVLGDVAPDGGGSVGSVSAVAIQGGGPRGFGTSQTHPATVLAAQLAATARYEGTDPPPSSNRLVLWPEDVVSLETNLSSSPERFVLSDLAKTLHSTLVVGVTETVSNTKFRNEVVAWGPDGTIVSRFEKVHRVPFGEYVPDRNFFAHLGNLSAVPRDAIPGNGSGLMTTPVAPLGAMVSYEVFYADRGRSSVRNGAELLIVPTNTASYASAQVPTQEIAASEIQAVEQGRDLLQAAPTGFSAAITNRGVLLQRSVLGKRQVILATLHRRTGWTIYVRYGDLPVLVSAAAALAVGWLIARRRSEMSPPDQS
jgi:apolipoprotein N-acyltransferase